MYGKKKPEIPGHVKQYITIRQVDTSKYYMHNFAMRGVIEEEKRNF